MDLNELVSRLEAERNWEGLAAAWREQVSAGASAEETARAGVALGRVLDERLGDKYEALRAYESAYAADPSNPEALRLAREVLRFLGQHPGVAKTAELELNAGVADNEQAAHLYVTMGDALWDSGSDGAAATAFARGLEMVSGFAPSSARLEDIQAANPTEHAEHLAGEADALPNAQALEMLTRAARTVRASDPAAYEAYLRRAFEIDPLNETVASLLEGALSAQGRGELLATLEDMSAAGLEDPRERAALFERFALRRMYRTSDPVRGVALLEQAVRLDPSRSTAFEVLKRFHAEQGSIDAAVSVADAVLAAGANGDEAYYLAQASTLLARAQQGDRARAYAARLQALAPGHSALGLVDAGAAPAPATAHAAEVEFEAEESSEEIVVDGGDDGAAPAVEAAVSPVVEVPAADEAAPAVEAPVAEGPKTFTAPDAAKLAAADEAIGKFETQKRWADVARALLQKADLYEAGDPERVPVLERIALVHVERTNNVAEAIKAYEAVLEADPDNAKAAEFLKSRYEQRRDWEKLLNLLRREARSAPASQQLEAFLSMARLATDKVKKPEVCIELWEEVLERDPANMDALTQLAGFYDRAKEFGKLAHVLREQAAQTPDAPSRIQLLVKLGTIAGDKLNDDQLSVEAWQGVLALDPNDRRAQEALKKRYLAMQAWDELEVFYADAGKWDELIRVLDREVENPQATDATKVKLFFKIAQLWAERKEKLDRAARYYERVLELEPANRRAALALIPIYEQANDAKKLASVYEVKLLGDESTDEKVETLRVLGSLYEHKLREASKAFERLRDAFAAAPEDPQSIDDLERSAAAASAQGQAADAIARALEGSLSGASAVSLRLRLGALLAGALGRVDDAIARYREVLDIDPANDDALVALEALFRQSNRPTDLMSVLEKRLELAATPEQRRALQYAIATLAENELSEPQRAVDTYVAIVAEFGDEAEALTALDRLYNKLERWTELADILERVLVVNAGDEALSLDAKYRLGRVLEQHLGRPREAIEHYSEILSLSEAHEPARTALEAQLQNPELRAEAARILEPIYEVRGDWEALIRAAEILLSGEQELDARIGLLRKIGDAYRDRLSDGARAFEAYGRALIEDPARIEVRDALEALAGPIEAWPRLVALHTQVAEGNVPPELVRASWLEVARIEEGKVGNVDAAVAAYEKVLSADPADVEALSLLEGLYRRTQRWADLLGVYRRRLELTADLEPREEILSAIAQVHDEHLNDAEAAIATYREMLSADPASNRALSALDVLFARLSRWSDLADNLQTRHDASADPEEQIGLMIRLAQLREEQMGEVETAVEIYRQVLARDGSNADALEALERLVQVPAQAVTVAEILEGVYREAGAYERLIGVHEIQVHYAQDPARKVDLLHRIADLQETALDRSDLAFQTFARALAEDPSHEGTVQGLERLARTLSLHQELAAVYEQRIAAVDNAEVKLSLHQRAADVHESLMGHIDGAIAHYKAMLEINPQHLPAVSALERLYQVGESYESLANTYLTKASLITDNIDEAKEYLFKASEIYESMMQRPNDAIGVFNRVLELDPEDLQAIDALIRLYVMQGNWAALLATYNRKIDLVTDHDAKKNLYFEVGSVYEGELQDVEKAIDAYSKVLELDPTDLVAIQRLDNLYLSQNNWPELLSILEREATLASDPAEISGYRYRIAEIHEKKLDDTTRAVDIYREILDAVPDHAPSLSALDAILHGEKLPLAAAAVLEPVYTASGAYAKLVDVLEVQLRFAQDPSSRVDLLHRIAEVYEQALENPAGAFDAYARAVPEDPLNELTLGNVERLADQVNGWRNVVTVYDAQLDRLASNPEQLVELALRTAQIYEVQVESVSLAVARYRRALEADNTNAVAIRSLGRLYEASEQWPELADILRRELELPDLSPDDQIAKRFQLAQVLEGALSEIDGAIDAYRGILDVSPDHTAAVTALESMFSRQIRQVQIAAILRPLYETQAEWEKLAQLNEATLSFVTDPAERLSAMHALAELCESQLADAGRALGWHARVLKESALDERSLSESERLAAAADLWADLAGTYADVVEASQDDGVKRQIGKRLARIYREELGDVESAEAAYNYVLSVAPLESESLEQLDQIYSAAGNAERLAFVLDRRVQATEDTLQKVEFTFRLAQILESDLGQTEQAIGRYRTIVEQLDAQHADSIDALERLYQGLERWQELYGTYERKLGIAVGDADRADITARMAQLASHYLGRPDESVRLWNEVLTLRGEDLEALEALAALHEAAHRHVEYIEVLERILVSTDEFERKVETGLRIAQVYQHALQNIEQAIESYRRVLDIEPSSLDALRALAGIYRAQQNWEELVLALQTSIQVGAAAVEPQELRDWWAELGRIFQNTLQQPFEATDAWRHALEVDPTDAEALDALLLIHTQQEQWNDVVDVLNMKVNAASPDEAKVPLLLQVASVWEQKLEQPDGARESYEHILRIDAVHSHAFATLEKLHEAAERWDPLVELYVSRYEALDESNVRERVDLLRRTARVHDDKRRDNEEAFAAALIAYEEDVKDKETVALLERLAGIGARWNELLQTVTEWWKTAEADRWTHIGLNMARWYGVELNRPEWAIPIYQQVIAREPDNLYALHSMSALYRKTQQWPQLAQLLERCVLVARDEGDKRAMHVELGEVLEKNLNRVDQAVEHYRTALASNGQDLAALSALERVHQARGEWTDLVEVLRKKAAAITDATELATARQRVGEVLEDQVGDAEGAVAAYRGVLELDARNIDALRGLERLYARLGRSQELLSVLEAQLEVVSTERERIKLLSRIGEMFEEEFVRLPEASQRFEQVLDIDPNNDHALRALERLYRRQGLFSELINTIDRHIAATTERRERAPLFEMMGNVYADELNDLDRSTDAFLNALDIEPKSVTGLEALARVYERRNDWSQAVDAYENLGRLVHDPAKAVEIRHRIAKVADEQLGDEERALELYQGVLDVDPSHLPTLASMRQIYIRRGDWHGATRYLEREIAATEAPRAKSRLHFELGRLWNEQLEEKERAVENFERGIEFDEDNEDAAYPLVFHYVDTQQWQKAEPLAEMLVRKSGRREAGEQIQLQLIMGRVAARLGKLDRAIRALSAAHALDRANIEVLGELARAYFDKQDWENAFKHYHLLLVHHKDELDPDGRADMYFRLGVIKREQGDRRRAVNFLEKALEEVPNHKETLEALVVTYTQTNEWEQVVAYKRALLDNHVFDKDERYTGLNELASLWQEKLKNAQKAISVLTEARDIRPLDHPLLMKLLVLYQETKQWSKVVETTEVFYNDIEKDPRRKAKYAYTIASVLNSELKNPDDAVSWYNNALDNDPKELKPFAKINEILTGRREFKQLERSFRKMIHRIAGKGERELEFNLWHNLGIIYRDRLNNPESAIAAFNMASGLKPEDVTEHKILAELYLKNDKASEAATHLMKVLEEDLANAEALSGLFDLHYKARAYDKAYCVASTMVFLLKDRVRSDARAFYDQYKPKRPLAPRARLDEERWIKDLFHPDEDVYVGKMFASILPSLRKIKTQPVARFGLTDKERQDPATSSVALVRALAVAGAAMSLPLMPLIYVRPAAPGGIQHVPSDPWASLAGSGVLQGMSPQDLQFLAAKHMAYYRNEHYVRTLFPTTTELTPLLLSAIKIAKPEFDVPPEVMPTAQTLATALSQDPVNFEGLKKVVKLFMEAGGQVNLKKWFQSVELTACRAGFLLSGELEVVKKILALEPGLPGDVSPNEKLKDVVLFSLSETYFRLREALGLTFQEQAAMG